MYGGRRRITAPDELLISIHNMKISVVKEYVKNALRLTADRYRNLTINSIRKTLRNSNYRHSFINEFMNRAERELKVEKKPGVICKRRRRYVSCPYVPGAMSFLRKVVKEAGIGDVAIAPLIKESNNSSLIFANLKDRRESSGIKNASFFVSCKNCDYKSRVFTGNYDIQRAYYGSVLDESSKIRMHCKEYGHAVEENIDFRSVTRYRSKYDMSIAKGFNL